MSAQVIAALRKRADREDELAAKAVNVSRENPPQIQLAMIHGAIAQALRDVAAEAERAERFAAHAVRRPV